MLLVDTKLGKSLIHGIGLFADQDISKGTAVYKSSPEFDVNISDEQYQQLDAFSKKQIAHYGYFDKKLGRWHMAFDDIRFCNHSDSSNISRREQNGEYQIVALRDISSGEELLQNYREFEDLRKEISCP